jgi:hypothetical protein
MHFGMARAQSHATPPNSTNIPVDSEKLFVVKRITNLSEPLKNKQGSSSLILSCA